MIRSISERLAGFCIKSSAVNENEKENYVFCFEVLLFDLASLCTVLLLAVVLGKVVETLAYLAAFTVIRLNAGGYHAGTHLGCYVTLCFSYIIFITLLILVPTASYGLFCFLSIAVSTAVIFALAPVQHVNRQLTPAEHVTFRRRCRLLTLLLSAALIMGVMLLPPAYGVYLPSGSFGMLAIALSLTAAKLINIYRRNRYVSR